MSDVIGPALSQDAGATASKSLQPGSVSDRRIFDAVRGSFLVSILTLPFGYLISIVLARVSPDAAGIYSVLGIYLGVISAFIYFGGGTVTIRFVTELAQPEQWAFFCSYFAVTVAFASALSILVWRFPLIVRPLTGSGISPELFLILLCVSPIPLLFFEIQATLRGLMEVTFAQALGRGVTVASCLLYGVVWIAKPGFFRQHYAILIISSYVGLMAISSLAGLREFSRIIGGITRKLSWHLPPGFWRFSLAVQIPSMLALLQLKIDEVSVLGALGLSQLGVYFVMSQLAGAAELLSNYFLDGIFPAIMNLDSVGNTAANEKLYAKAGKYVALIGAVTIFPLFCFAQQLLKFLGSKYSGNAASFFAMLVFASLDCFGPLNHTLIVGLKRMRAWTIVQAVRLVGFAVFFQIFARRFGLLGVVFTRGVAWLIAGALGYWIVLQFLPIRVRIPRQYFLYSALSCILLLVSHTAWASNGSWIRSCVTLLVASGLFLSVGRYRVADLYELGVLRRSATARQT